jgi:hypothetical protein
MKTKIKSNPTEVYKVYRTTSDGLTYRETQYGNYIDGVVATVYGYVKVYCEASYYSLDFIWASNQYHFSSKSDKMLSNQSLAAKAGKFAKEIVQGSYNNLIEE